MSALCQKRTFCAAADTGAIRSPRRHEQRNCQAERPRSLRVAGSGESSSRQPPYDQDDYDEDSNLINVAHGIAIFSPLSRPQSLDRLEHSWSLVLDLCQRSITWLRYNRTYSGSLRSP